MINNKNIITLFLVYFLTTNNIVASEADYCESEIEAAAIQLALTKAQLLILIGNMKKLDNELKKESDLLDLKVMKTLDEGSNLSRSTSTMQSTTSSITTLVNTSGIVAKTRLVYLKAAILRFQFYASNLSAKELEAYEDYKKNKK